FDIPSEGGAGGGSCAATSVGAALATKPIDLILMVDTSSSMAPVSNAVEQNINQNLAAILEASGLDYRVIALAGYGPGAQLCVGPPLGGADCASPPPAPANTERFFHYQKASGSGSILEAIIAWYTAPDDSGAAPNGFSGWLRPDSQKVFLIFSDTESTSNATSVGDTFDANLLALDPEAFGTPEARKYTLHSIIGLKQSTPPTAAYLPSDPIVSGVCSGMGDDLGSGKAVQQVSILSGGLRFPVCQYAAFDTVFNTIAANVVEEVVLACDIPLPSATDGGEIDPTTVEVDFTPSGGAPLVSFHQVPDLAACEPNAFYIEAGTITLCPEGCSAVQGDALATLDVRYGCDVGYVE
ncbi:MAG: hypothetical protein JNK04_21610, partial [Myxococcales bacterium]|nr:hypothetical protein [Myxococcales bacterium]